jgi:DNA helicase-2/ATP-dependent DNA helicase PcrA
MSLAPDHDPTQRPDANLLVIAPPGCGKTELLAHRAAYLIPTLEPHQRVLALTFSNRAKANLRERLLTVLGPQRFRRYIKVTNFHGHAAELITAHGGTIGVDPCSPMPGRSTLETAISEYTRGLSFDASAELKKMIEEALAEAKREARDDDEVAEALALIGNVQAQAIERDRRQRGLLHYHDLLRHAQRLLNIDEIAHLYQQHFGALLVDEFQDLSPQQLEIALASGSTSRTFVGDPLQGIYSWAGARPVEVEVQLREICGEPHHLTVSYRSSPAVLTVVNRVSSLLGGQTLQSADPSTWLGGGAAVCVTFESGRQEALWILDMSTKILAANPKATIGVIARAGWRRRPIDEVFAAAVHLSTQRWDLAIQDSVIVQHILTAVRRLPRKASMEMTTRAVLEDIDLSDVETREQAIEALAEFETLVRRAGTPAAAAAQLRVPDDTKAIGPGVHLLNAHTGKGQQFDWVFVPGVEDFHIPSGMAKTSEELEEELRVLLVILSRARHGIAITRALSLVSKKGNPYHTKTSKWWTELASACSMDAETVIKHLQASLPDEQAC